MGAGIAQLLLVAGHVVDLVDPDPVARARVRRDLARRLGRLAAGGRLEIDPDEVLARLSVASALPAGSFAVAIEAVPERRA